MNPFLPSTSGQSSLREEQYQQIHLQALQKAIQRGRKPDTPLTLPLDRLKDAVKKYGLESTLLHPADLETLFAGVSQAVYRTTADLYCSHLGRSIPIVWKLLNVMANQVQATSPSYEAIWACCLSFEQRQRETLTITCERGPSTWWLGQMELKTKIRVSMREHLLMVSPLLYYVADCSTGQILASGVAPKEMNEEQSALTFYEAILTQRRPARNTSARLVWHLPQRLVTAFSLPNDCQKACRMLRIPIENRQELPEFAQTLHSNWAATLVDRVLLPQHCLLLLETYLTRHTSSGPLHLQEERTRQYGHLLGYQRDAVWHFPLLRAFLPKRQATITHEGTVVFQGLQYQDPLLSYWPNTLVTFHFSPASDILIWVYLEEEIVCQAYAKERRPQQERHRALHAER